MFLFSRSVGLANDTLALYRRFESSLLLWCKSEYSIALAEFVKIPSNNNIKINPVKYLTSSSPKQLLIYIWERDINDKEPLMVYYVSGSLSYNFDYVSRS